MPTYQLLLYNNTNNINFEELNKILKDKNIYNNMYKISKDIDRLMHILIEKGSELISSILKTNFNLFHSKCNIIRMTLFSASTGIEFNFLGVLSFLNTMFIQKHHQILSFSMTHLNI